MRNGTSKDEELTEQQENNVIRPAFGISMPPENWLKELDIGTVFLSRRKSNSPAAVQDFTLVEFCKVGQSEKGVRLAQPQGLPGWVDPVRFCNQMDYVETIGQQSFVEVGEEIDDEHQGTI